MVHNENVAAEQEQNESPSVDKDAESTKVDSSKAIDSVSKDASFENMAPHGHLERLEENDDLINIKIQKLIQLHALEKQEILGKSLARYWSVCIGGST